MASSELLQLQPITSHERFLISRPIEERSNLHSMEPQLPEVVFHAPHERKDSGAIEYTTVPVAIEQWAKDPHGEQKIAFLSHAYGIPPTDVRRVLEKAGMQEYLRYKSEGRMIGMVATQIFKPSHYFVENAKMLTELHKRGVPTALMAFDYGQDRYSTRNSDKVTAFGKVEFPVGVEEIHQPDGSISKKMKTIKIELRPTGIRHDDETIHRINSINQADGYRCDQIIVEIVDAKGPNNQSYTEVIDEKKTEETQKDSSGKKTGSKVHTTRTTRVYYQAALGVEIPHLVNTRTTVDGKEVYFDGIDNNAITLTDFYRELWKKTISHMRDIGELPSEEEMPMFFVDMQHLYKTLGENAKPPEEVVERLQFSSHEQILKKVLLLSDTEADTLLAEGDDAIATYLAQRDLFLKDGLLYHENGMMQSGSYYPVQAGWPDLYLECSSCGGDKFVGQLQRAQQVRHDFGLPEVEVRLPDAEVKELEMWVIHPSDNIVKVEVEKHPEERELAEQIRELKVNGQTNGLTKKEIKEKNAPKEERIENLRAEALQAYMQQVKDRRNLSPIAYVEPDIIIAVHAHLAEGIDEAIQKPEVQRTIKKLTK